MRGKIVRGLLPFLLILIRVFHTLFRIFPMKKGDEVMILALKRIGDTVLMLPALREYLQFQSDDRLVIVSHASNADIFKRYLPGITCLFPDKKDYFMDYPLPKISFLHKVRSRRTKLIIDATGDYSSTPYLFCNRTASIIGTNVQKYQFLYTKYVPIRTTPHLHDFYFDIFHACENRLKKDFQGFPVRHSKVKTIGMNPLAGWLSKQWSINKFIALTRRLQTTHSVVWIIQSGSLQDDYIRELQTIGVVVNQTRTVDDLISALQKVDLFIGNDSGPIHLAALAGVPTFAIYGPTNPAYIKPLGDYHESVRAKLPCIPVQEHYCFTDGGHTCPSYECMALLSVEEVVKGFWQFMEHLGRQSNES